MAILSLVRKLLFTSQRDLLRCRQILKILADSQIDVDTVVSPTPLSYDDSTPRRTP